MWDGMPVIFSNSLLCYRSMPLDPVLSQLNPVYILTYYSAGSISGLQSVPWSRKLSLPLGFLSKILYKYLIQETQQQMFLIAYAHIIVYKKKYVIFSVRNTLFHVNISCM